MAQTYKLHLRENNGLSSEKKEYAAGETVTVWLLCMASDTRYEFYADVPDKQQIWEDGKVGVRFTMPAHDVEVSAGAESVMTPPPSPPWMGMGMMAYAGIAQWNCPACGTQNTGKFCTECGSKKP